MPYICLIFHHSNISTSIFQVYLVTIEDLANAKWPAVKPGRNKRLEIEKFHYYNNIYNEQ